MAVLGFRASNRASTIRLKPMAAVRAVTMAATIQPIRVQVSGATLAASTAPARAKGSAKTVWLNRMNEAYVRSRDSMWCVDARVYGDTG